MSDNVDRNSMIEKLVAKERLSYAVIAEMMGVTRNVVAGVVFRATHPYSIRVKSPAATGKNKVGHGYQHRTYYPEKTAANTR